MKKTLSIILVLIPIISFAQDEDYVFKYLELKVKTVKLSKWEKINYEYKESVIIESEDYPNKVERHYHYSKIGNLDSTVYFEIYEDTIYTFRRIYEYNKNDKLVKIRDGGNLEKEIIKIDSFIYNSDKLIDSVLWFSNRKETIFRTERTDAIRLYAFSKFEYDNHLRLIRKKSNQPFGAKEIEYFYDGKGNVSKTIEYFGLTRSDCLVGEDKSYSVSIFTYNEMGLLVKEVSKNHLLQPNGKKKGNGKYKFRRKYEFY